MSFSLLSETVLFRGLTPDEIEKILPCLRATQKNFHKEEYIFHAGSTTRQMGLVLEGGVNIEMDDLWGNKNILSHVGAGQIFAETYACLADEPLIVSAAAAESSKILLLDAERLFTPCSSACSFHTKLSSNLVLALARKNLLLSQRIQYTASKSIRGRLLSYLSSQAVRQNASSFTIPFNRQQLADYLSVDRSALSNELSKMRREGLLDFSKNRFILNDLSSQ